MKDWREVVDLWQAEMTIKHRKYRVLATWIALMRYRRYSPRVSWQMARQSR